MRERELTDGRAIQNADTFGLVFDRHFAVVHRYIRRRLGEDAADELAAEVFLRAFANRSRYDRERPSARPWLLGIASRLILRRYRDEERMLRAYARSVDGAEISPAGISSPQLESDVASALLELTADEREAILLYAWADLTYEEIADALEIPIGTVRSRLHNARRRLRAQLEGSADQDVLRVAWKE